MESSVGYEANCEAAATDSSRPRSGPSILPMLLVRAAPERQTQKVGWSVMRSRCRGALWPPSRPAGATSPFRRHERSLHEYSRCESVCRSANYPSLPNRMLRRFGSHKSSYHSRSSRRTMDPSASMLQIDMSRQCRALAWLRLTDYMLLILCGSVLLSLAISLWSWPMWARIVGLIVLAFLCFVLYTVWRHVGVIDPAVWRVYRIVLPLIALPLLVAAGLLTITSSMNHDRTETFLQLEGIVLLTVIAAVPLAGWISLFALRKGRIAAIDVTVDELLQRLSTNAGVRAVDAANIKRINKPWGIVLGLVGAMFPVVGMLGQHAQPIPIWVSIFLLLRARRYFQVDADSLLAVDHRPPILFLRSFDDEKQRYGTPNRAFLGFSLELRLSNHFSRFGPFVAIGSPKETVPEPGAARVLLSDDEWQSRVLQWIKDADLIIMYSGKTHWVNWELRRVLENGGAARLILMIPEIKGWRKSKRQNDISARVQQLREVFKDTPWDEDLSQFDDFTGLRAMLFRADGTVVILESRSRSRDSYHLAALVAHDLLLNAKVHKTSIAAPVGTPASGVDSSVDGEPVARYAGKSDAGTVTP